MKKLLFAIPSLLLLISLAACTSSKEAPITNAEQAKPMTTTITPTQGPQKIALLLPLTGTLSSSGQAVRNGFLSAYYHANTNNKSNLQVKVIDTNKGNISNLYQQAINDGNIFIVGPLTKPDVQVLANLRSLPVPTLALNTLDNYNNSNVTNLYQFGLASSDEALQLADRAISSNLHHALIISPDSSWGQSITTTLRNAFEARGGSVASTLTFNKSTKLDAAIRDAFQVNIPVDKANQPQKGVLPTFRSDVDVVFLIASPAQGRIIQPLLRFYMLGKIPTYATSSIYSGTLNSFADRDLDGVIFCDIPWVLAGNSLPPDLLNLQTDLQKLWQDSYRKNNRLYALGIDSYYLSMALNRLNTISDGIAGTTGTLYVDKNNHIYRKIVWAKMQNGVPQLIN